MLRTARKYATLPCRYLGLPRDPEVDYALTLALELYEEGLCPGGCGQHMDEAHDPVNEGRYEQRTMVCQACAVSQPGGEHKPQPGELVYVWRNPKEPRRRRGKRGAARPVKP